MDVRRYLVLNVCRVNLESPPLLEDPLLVSIGKKYKKNSAHVALRFNAQRGVASIPKSFSSVRIQDNFQVRSGLKCAQTAEESWHVRWYGFIFCVWQIFDFSLTDEEMSAIENLNKNVRFVELLM